MNTFKSYFTCLVIGLLFVAQGSFAQNGQKVLSLDDYPKWNRLMAVSMSEDGRWTSFTKRPNDGDDTLYIKALESSALHVVPFGSSANFSEDGKWVAYLINPNKKEVERLQRERKPVVRKAELLNLQSGEKWSVNNAASVSFSPDSKFFMVKKAKSDPAPKHAGTDLILRNLQTGATQNIGNVAEYGFNQRSNLLAFTVDADMASGNGVYLLRTSTMAIQPIDTDTLEYSSLSWNDQGFERPIAMQKGYSLAVVKGHKPEKQTKKANRLIVASRLDQPQPVITHYNPADDSSFPNGWILSESGNIGWSESDNTLFVNLGEQRPEPPKVQGTLTNVEVWHWNDEEIQSVQKVRQNMLRNQTYRAAFHVSQRKLVPLGDDSMRTIMSGRNAKSVIGGDPRDYIADTNWGISPSDYYHIDTETGQRALIEKGVGRMVGVSPDQKKFVYLKDGEIYAYDLGTKRKTHITSGVDVSFVDEDDDHPYEKPTFGSAGFSKDRRFVILNHKFDLYRVALDGSGAINLTSGLGDKENIRFRYLNTDPNDPFIDLSKPMILTAYGEWTKKSGFYSMQPGKAPVAIAYTDHRYGRPMMGRNTNKVMYTRESFVDFPDYYVSTMDFRNPVKVTDANPQQKEYGWGRRILVDYVNGKGEKMQATLALPAGYEPGKQYPMLVYFYEKMSQNHHSYSMPSYDDRPHMSYYASNGYLVLQPDVTYDVGTPGSNALDCVTSAVKEVIKLGYADPAKVGLQGHSWGGYQSSFIVTQTDMFACVVTGAPVTNLVSMYNILYKQSGRVNHGIFELGQVRMGANVTPWSHRDLYVSQSPIEHVDKIKTPFMILHGTADGAVDYNQGLEFYTAARRMGKEVILLTYPDEPHHLNRLENQKDFLKRMKEYFDHHVKGAPAPKWMTEGMPFINREYELSK